jgi:hypothetical protein
MEAASFLLVLARLIAKSVGLALCMWYWAFGYGALNWLDDLVNLGMLLGSVFKRATA